MFTYLDAIDRQWLLAINGWHTAYLDQLMWLVSSRLSWALIALGLLYALRDKGWRTAALTLLAVALTAALADQVSSGLIKHAVERLRPTHQPALEGMVHVVHGYTGGLYGFVSSHAANSFGVALIVGLLLRSRPALWALMAWAALQCYSRMYLGVHYPGDILGGTAVGLLAAWAVYGLWLLAQRRWPAKPFTPADGRQIVADVVATVISLAVGAAIMT